MPAIEIAAQHRVHGGTLSFVRHYSVATGTHMIFSIFVPHGDGPFPAVIWLSGLTCTANNFTEKAGAYKKASELGLIIVAPDTSPRGPEVANDNSDGLGQGAGFYVDATQVPWKAHFQMESYVTRDLIEAVDGHFPTDPARRGIMGHSMGGHGALTLAMNHAHLFRSVSAFSPIASVLHSPWGETAMTAYLGPDRATWERHDAAELIASGAAKPFDDILIDQGLADPFLETQLMTDRLPEAAATAGQALTLRTHAGYDHGYYFIQSFIGDHLEFHLNALKPGGLTRQ